MADIERRPSTGARRDGTAVAVTAGVGRAEVRLRPGLGAPGRRPCRWPVIPTGAGHDAGILAAAGIPTAMLFVRNPTGISHSPEECAAIADCLAGVARSPTSLAELAGTDDVLVLEHAWLDGAVPRRRSTGDHGRPVRRRSPRRAPVRCATRLPG